ncbi:MAG: tyrosine--tRNA ligase [Candidatus Marinimicrobia bacterium]|nr:tyrosine--tRNA ligase [Candidatus Neomarinimicrobiota bacterium]|tara:strand:+ start:37 stop:1248 length:1212 start_codon:yes stop_codon:yes gene_type:complete
MSFLSVKEQMDVISRGVEEIIPEGELISKLESSKKSGIPLTVKLGCDPSRPDLHIGHGVVLRKMRHFQDLGHQAVLVIGDFTAMIGDPSGRIKTRPQLTLEEAKANAESYVEQSKVILDINKLKILYNSEWLNSMNFSDVIRLAGTTTVARMLERDDFTKRYKAEIPISLHEFLYPLAQGQDSVELNADIELGGTDQKFNLLVGRNLQKEAGQDPQCIITLPLLEGTDGKEKMSKSYNNDIGLQDKPEDIYGKILSIKDEMIEKWFILAADANEETLDSIESQIKDPSVNPMDLKKQLARSVVTLYYDIEIAKEAEAHFNNLVVKKGIPDDMPEFGMDGEKLLVDLIAESGILNSKSEARRMITQGAVRLDGVLVDDINAMVFSGGEQVLKIGKRRFLRIVEK